MWIHVNPIERQPSILKMVQWEVFLMNPKHQHHLSQWEECVYGAQSWNERRLLSNSVFIPTERQTSVLKMVERQVFLMKPNHQYNSSQWEKFVYGAQSWNEKILLCEFVFITIERRTSILKMVEIVIFSIKPNHQYHLSQWGECVYGAQSLNERRLLCKSAFIQIKRQTLILKMVESDVFIMNPNHQYHLSQWGLCVYGAQSWNERRFICESVFILTER